MPCITCRPIQAVPVREYLLEQVLLGQNALVVLVRKTCGRPRSERRIHFNSVQSLSLIDAQKAKAISEQISVKQAKSVTIKAVLLSTSENKIVYKCENAKTCGGKVLDGMCKLCNNVQEGVAKFYFTAMIMDFNERATTSVVCCDKAGASLFGMRPEQFASLSDDDRANVEIDAEQALYLIHCGVGYDSFNGMGSTSVFGYTFKKLGAEWNAHAPALTALNAELDAAA